MPLELRSTDKVLEIGTGSGYQAAILAELAGEIISVERVPDLAESALETLRDLRYTTVEVNLATVQLGWPERAPYDSIIVAAGAPKLPRELMEQMAAGARLVVPVGSRESQELMKVTRTAETYSVETLGACRFVPLDRGRRMAREAGGGVIAASRHQGRPLHQPVSRLLNNGVCSGAKPRRMS